MTDMWCFKENDEGGRERVTEHENEFQYKEILDHHNQNQNVNV